MGWIWIVLFVLILTYWFLGRQSKLKIPGPEGLPIFGCTFQVDRQRPYVTITEWAKQYGPVFVAQMFTTQTVFVNTYDVIYDVLVTKGDEFSDRSSSFRANIWNRGKQDLTFSSPASPHWPILRTAAQKYMKQYSSVTTGTVRPGNKMLFELLNKFEDLNGIAFDMREQLYSFALQLLILMVFGEKLDGDELTAFKDFERKITANLGVSGQGMLLDEFPWLRYFPNKVYKEMTEASAFADAVWKRYKNKFYHRSDTGQADCAMKVFMKLANSLKRTDNSAVLQDVNLQLSLLELIGAGSTTTTASLSAFVALLVNHTDVQRKLQTETDLVMGHDTEVTLLKRNEMPYTRAAIYEMLRYTSVAPLGAPHVALQDTEVGGYFIPKGTVVATNLWMLHHDDEFWGDPWNYRPERYLDQSGQLLPADHPNRKRMLPFGAGPRVCLGEEFVLSRIFLFIVALMQRFDVLPEQADKMPACDPRTYNVGFTIHPKNFKVRIVRRQN